MEGQKEMVHDQHKAFLEELPVPGVAKWAFWQTCLIKPGKAEAQQSEAYFPSLLPYISNTLLC